MSTVLKDALLLSVEERLQLIEEIWDRRTELARRRRVHARNPSAAKPWEEVRAKLERRR
jgi:hypothetical protein